MNFLTTLAHHVFDAGKTDYQDVAIVVPNKRAQQRLYLEMAELVATPVFAPTVLAMDDLILSLSPLNPIDTPEQLVELFDVYKNAPYKNDNSFLSFMNWARTFLHDIDEIDQYLTDADQIFTNLSDLKNIDLSFHGELSENQRKYLDFYVHLNDLYTSFKTHLFSLKKGYKGMIYRDVVENIATYAKDFPYRKIVFAGLLSLSPAEQRIARYFRENAEVEFLFDLDEFYYKNERLNIGKMVEEVKRTVGLEKIAHVSQDYRETEKEVTITGASQSMGQVFAAVEILNKMDEKERNETAVVFADESLLLPFIHAYGYKNCNITMSYPARHTAAFHLLQDLMTAAQNYRRLNYLDTAGHPVASAGYYHKDVFTLLQNPLFTAALFADIKEFNEAKTEILNLNHVFIPKNQLDEKLKIDFPDLAAEGHDFLDVLRSFLEKVAAGLQPETYALDCAVLKLLASELAKVDEILQHFDPVLLDFRTISMFIDEQIGNLGIPFLGNPDKGLQLMGILETRTLDFKNIIMLSVNEGVIPAGKSTDSLILFELKRGFNLPTFEHKDTTYAYHFFRLLQRASKIHLIYDTDTSSSANEASRFIQQFEFEVKNQNLQNTITFHHRNASVRPRMEGQNHLIEIDKTDDTVATLRELTYSASKLSDYINCPLQFYLKHVAAISPQQSIDENIEQNVIGKVMHKVLEELALEIIKFPDDFKKIIKQFGEKIDKGDYLKDCFYLNDVVKGQDLTKGKLLLAVEVVKQQLRKYFAFFEKELDDKDLAIKIIEPEKRMEFSLKMDDISFRIKGFADLVELRDGKSAIMDYKTGKIHSLNYENMDDVFSNPDKHQLCQLLMYAYLYHKLAKEKPENITCALVSFQKLMSGEKCICPPTDEASGKILQITETLLTEFEKQLKALLTEITSTEIPFSQTDDLANCKFCDYQAICSRNAM